jgi:adenylate cyclase
MADDRIQRRLAAILAADVVGYSRMMERDETGTLARLRALRSKVFDPATHRFDGRIFKTTGDGALAEFGSAVDAVQCAVEIQRALAERNADLPEHARIILRIGISLGDVIVEGDDLYGNGVNVAARMEGLAEPGAICVSGNVHEHMGNALDVTFEDLGEQAVKNMDRPVRSYRVHLDPAAARPVVQKSGTTPVPDAPPTYFDKPSIAVLSFENMSGDPEQEFFSDGLTEDLITALSYWSTFSVIARNSTFQYKGKSPDVRAVASELGVRYVLEGSVRKSGERVRITAQLIDGATGKHVWAEKYDRQLIDFFDLQDELTQVIAAKVEPEFAKAEHKRVAQKPSTDLDAWELYHRGFAALQEMTGEGNLKSQEFFKRVISCDPSNSRGHTGLGYALFRHAWDGYAENTGIDSRIFIEHAKRAIALDDADAMAHMLHSIGLLFSGKFDSAIAEGRRAVELNPNFSSAYVPLGNALMVSGQPAEAIQCFEISVSLSPIDPRNFIYFAHLAEAHYDNRDYNAAVETAERAIAFKPDDAYAHFVHAIALGQLDRSDEARLSLSECLRIRPDYVQKHPQLAMYKNPADREHILDGLDKAGLSE